MSDLLDSWTDAIVTRAELESKAEPPPPYRLTDGGLEIREDVLANAVWAANSNFSVGPVAIVKAVLEEVFGNVKVVEDRLT